MNHDQVVELLGACTCDCHDRRASAAGCWCRSRTSRIDTLRLHHNTRLTFGRCTCPCHVPGGTGCCCNERTSPQMQAALDQLEQRQAAHRWRTGQPTTADITRAVTSGKLRF
jgi:hypothetical protein